MTHWKVLAIIFATLICIQAKQIHQQKRETKSSICDLVYNNTNSIQCYCSMSGGNQVRSADCYPAVDGVPQNDESWELFEGLKTATVLTLTNTKGHHIKYIPTNAFKHTKSLLKLTIKYGVIDTIEAYAFANHSTVEEIFLRDNQITALKANAFAHHRDLKIINLDYNSIIEVNRDVFIDLPALKELYLTKNKITTIHDRAFVHLTNLKDLEIDGNNIFSLNSESFSGLVNLRNLDLSGNSLEVIGDNTFLPLAKLEMLNLDGNKIQMIDEKAFHGLSNLQALSLAHNALKNLDNVKIFVGLNSTTTLNLKANPLEELKKDVIAPLLPNLYETGSLNIEDINFPCDCRLEWLMTLMNKTKNRSFKQSLENLKCVPDAQLRERYNSSMYEEEQDKPPKTAETDLDYEFYDDTQLDGKLFYIDLKLFLNCSGNEPHTKVLAIPTNPVTTGTSPKANPAVTTNKQTQITNQRLLDLAHEELARTERNKDTDAKNAPNQGNLEKKPDSYTTNRLATVSAKPMEIKYEEHDMASDEAKPDTIKSNKRTKDGIQELSLSNDANKTMNSLSMLIAAVLLKFCYS